MAMGTDSVKALAALEQATSGGLSAVELRHDGESTLWNDEWRQRLREWCSDAGEKHGKQRSEGVVVSCFAPLLRWIVTWWAQGEHRLALALDASTLSDRFTVLCISVVYRGCALPMAWCIVPAGEPGAWKPDWIALLNGLDGVIPAEWTVIVLADRGLYARWLYREIQALQWHPFLRSAPHHAVRHLPRSGIELGGGSRVIQPT